MMIHHHTEYTFLSNDASPHEVHVPEQFKYVLSFITFKYTEYEHKIRYALTD